ncbi:TatD family hydrolase [Oceanicella actignis]|uniref:TatD DNase family protein n=1 Tax=Oceanicella actignis TaxID=1189325 RepID=A0A1M7TIA3_9RHOB|nr:TatD family hydrolase [Oceanicella actignis]SET58021.1 TatD DNase family protein [Oceanicella actignis]SHN70436.1 TatD DNase family protein [Oceanicella actignis]
MPPVLADSHCHLDFPDFADDLPQVIERAQAAGVTRMVSICTRLDQEPRVRAIAEAHAPVFYAVGVHPMNVGRSPEATVEALVALARHPKMVGIGETGIDLHYSADTRDAQIESLRVHAEAARRTGLPLIIHARDADEDVARVLREERAAGAFGCVMHCFSSGRALAEEALSLGFHLSMSGIAAFKRSDALRAIFRDAPLDRILVETDAPYLAPPPHRGKRNEPAHVALTAQVGAELFGLSLEAFAAATTANFERLFAKAAAWAPQEATA